MKLARVVHCKKEPYDVLVDRSTEWGNPFILGRDGNRAEVCAKHRVWFLKQEHLIARLPELQGKTLACWCKPAECHVDFIAALVNENLTGEKNV